MLIKSPAGLVFTDICNMLNRTVGKNLRMLRLMHDYSQEDVELGVAVSRSTLSKIENGVGKIDLDRLEKFAKFFKVDVVTIITMSDKKEPYQKPTDPVDLSEYKTDYSKADVDLARCQEKVGGLKKEIAQLKQEVSQHKSQIKDKDLIIKLLNK